MSNIKTFSARDLISAETSSIDLGDAPTDDNSKDSDKAKDGKDKDNKEAISTLSDSESDDLCAWLRLTLGEKKVRTVKTTKR